MPHLTSHPAPQPTSQEHLQAKLPTLYRSAPTLKFIWFSENTGQAQRAVSFRALQSELARFFPGTQHFAPGEAGAQQHMQVRSFSPLRLGKL